MKDKPSFILYADLIHTVEQMPNDKAGELFKHILQYVNDQNPTTEDLIIKLSFEPIKQQLKRDLKKWESKQTQRSEAGKRSAELREAKRNETNVIETITNTNEIQRPLKVVEQTSTNPTVNVNGTVNGNGTDTVNGTVIKKEIGSRLLSEIDISEVAPNELYYFKFAVVFQQFIIDWMQEKKIPTKIQEKAKYSQWVDPIRLMLTVDGYEMQDLKDMGSFLRSNDFWKKNIQSTAKFREKASQLLAEARTLKTKAKGYDREFLEDIYNKAFNPQPQ